MQVLEPRLVQPRLGVEREVHRDIVEISRQTCRLGVRQELSGVQHALRRVVPADQGFEPDERRIGKTYLRLQVDLELIASQRGPDFVDLHHVCMVFLAHGRLVKGDLIAPFAFCGHERQIGLLNKLFAGLIGGGDEACADGDGSSQLAALPWQRRRSIPPEAPARARVNSSSVPQSRQISRNSSPPMRQHNSPWRQLR